MQRQACGTPVLSRLRAGVLGVLTAAQWRGGPGGRAHSGWPQAAPGPHWPHTSSVRWLQSQAGQSRQDPELELTCMAPTNVWLCWLLPGLHTNFCMGVQCEGCPLLGAGLCGIVWDVLKGALELQGTGIPQTASVQGSQQSLLFRIT